MNFPELASKSFSVRKAVLLILVSSLVFSCKVDERYRLGNIEEDLDTEVTLFGEGITVPLGKTKQIRVDSLLALAGKETQDLLTLSPDGAYSIRMEDSIDLSEEIADLDLSAFANINGVTVNEHFNYSIGDFNVDNLTVEGSEYSTSIVFDEIAKVSDIKIKAFNENETLNVAFSEIIPEEDRIIPIDSFEGTYTVMKKSIVEEEMMKYSATSTSLVDLSGIMPKTVDVSTEIETIGCDEIVLDESIASVSDVHFDPSSKIIVNVSLVKPFLTDGTIVPDVTLDLSKLFKIKGVNGPLSFTKQLNPGNNWSSSYEFTPEYLIQESFTGNTICLSKDVKIGGKIYIYNPVSSGAHFFASDDTPLKVEVVFENIKISSAEVVLAEAVVSPETHFEVPLDFGPFEVPEQIKRITVIMDESKPISLSLSSSGLAAMKEMSVVPDIAVHFPSGLVVDGADGDGVLRMSGNISNGSLSRNMTIKSFSICPVNGKIEFHDKIIVDASATTSGSFNIAQIPEEDAVLTASVKGAPAIKDYLIELDPVTQAFSYSQDCSFDVAGIGSFGSFSVYPDGDDNRIELTMDIPEIRGISILAKEPGIKATFPPYVVFKDLDSKLNFDSKDNSITIKGELPHSIVLPIEKLLINPVAVGDTYHIDGAIDINGAVEATPESADGTINKDVIDDISGKIVTLKANVPTMRAKRVELDGDFSFEFEQELDEMTFLSADEIPEQIQSISELLLNDVFANVGVNIKGLPDLGDSKFKLHMEITLPEMIDPSVIVIDKDLETNDDGSVSADLSEQIIALRNIDFTTREDISGKLSVKGALTAVKPHINDIAQLKSEISCDITGSLGNKDGKIVIGTVTGRVLYAFNSSMSCEINDIPEILKGDDIVLDILPELSLSMTTNIGIPVIGSIVLTPYIGEEAIETNKVVIANVALPYSADGKEVTKGFFIARNASDKCPDGYEAIDQNLSSLIRQIPDSIKVTVDGGVDDSKDCTVEPGTAYTCRLDYLMNVPLAFGEDFTATITKDFEFPSYSLGANAILLSGTVTNSTPLELELEYTLLDENGAEIKSGENSSITIPCCDAQGNAVECPINFGIDLTESGDLAIKTVRLSFKIKAQPGIALQDEDYFQVELFASLPQGFTFNAGLFESKE